MIALITTILGIVSTVLAWNLNPRRKIYAELDKIFNELEVTYAARDRALKDNNSDVLTQCIISINRLCNRKELLFSRLG